jgi:hypothetical protein
MLIMAVRSRISLLVTVAVFASLVALPAGASTPSYCSPATIKSHEVKAGPQLKSGVPSVADVHSTVVWVVKADEDEASLPIFAQPPTKVSLGNVKTVFGTLGIDDFSLLADRNQYVAVASQTPALKSKIEIAVKKVNAEEILAEKDLNTDLNRALAACKGLSS